MNTEQINVVDIIIESISTIFSNLFSSIDANIYSVLDDLVFINADIVDTPSFKALLGTSNVNSMVALCNSIVIGFVLYYAISSLFSYLTFSKSPRPAQFIFKLLLCLLFVNSSYYVSELLVSALSRLSLYIRGFGEYLFDTPICFSTLIEKINSIIYSGDSEFNIFSLDGILKSFVSFGLLNLILTYAIRYIMLQVFLLLSPFAFLSLSLENTQWIFKSWVKIVLSLLFLQILVSAVLVICFSFGYTSSNDLFSKILYVGSIFALMKSNTFIRDFMGGLSSDVNLGMSSLKSYMSGGNS